MRPKLCQPAGCSIDLTWRVFGPRKLELFGFWEITAAKLKLKGIDGRAPSGLDYVAQLDSTPSTQPGPKRPTKHGSNSLADERAGGAWPP